MFVCLKDLEESGINLSGMEAVLVPDYGYFTDTAMYRMLRCEILLNVS